MSSGLGLVIRQNKSGGGGIPPGVLIDALNGTNDTATPNTVELGGPLIRNTDISGLFNLGFINNRVGVGVASGSVPVGVKFFSQNQSTAPTDGTVAVLGQNVLTPAALIGSTNIYGIVGTLSLNLATSNVGGLNSFNATGVAGSLVIANNNGVASTRRLRALMGGLSLSGNALVNDIATIEARSPEQFGTNTVTNLYGLYIDQQAATGVTTAYGIFQASTQDINFFNGPLYGAGMGGTFGSIIAVAPGAGLNTLSARMFVYSGSAYFSAADPSSATLAPVILAGGYITIAGAAGIGSLTYTLGGFPIFSIENSGRIAAYNIHNNPTLPIGTSPSYIASGTYTPTLFNTTNVAASTPFVCQWIRTGNVVSVSGSVDIDATAATATILGMSLPIPSTLVAHNALGGTAANGNDNPVQITGDTVNNRATFSYAAIDLALRRYSFIFQYVIN